MLRLARKDGVENLSRLLLSDVALVARHHPGGDERQCIENTCLTIGRSTLVKLLHRVAVSKRPRLVIELVVVLVKDFHRRNEIPFALIPGSCILCLRDCVGTLL